MTKTKKEAKEKKSPKKPEVVSKDMEKSLEAAEEEMQELGSSSGEEHALVQIKPSKPIAQIKKGDKVRVDSLTLEVDAHYVLIDHGSTKEMTIELFDPKTEKDYQLRYFSGQVERSIEFYELEEIIYNKKDVKKIEW